jgi:hypothetical protein
VIESRRSRRSVISVSLQSTLSGSLSGTPELPRLIETRRRRALGLKGFESRPTVQETVTRFAESQDALTVGAGLANRAMIRQTWVLSPSHANPNGYDSDGGFRIYPACFSQTMHGHNKSPKGVTFSLIFAFYSPKIAVQQRMGPEGI